jgi:predicted outer membrane repeat protein
MRFFHGAPVVLLAFIATFSLGAGYARAATYTVTNTNDDLNPGSLRWAVSQADANPGSTIGFSLASPSTINLSNGPLSVTASVAIVGPGLASLAINGNGSQIFNAPSSTAPVLVNISGVTLQGGQSSGSGGAVYVGQNVALALQNVAFTGNSARNGGAVYAAWGAPTLSVSQCSFSANSAQSAGGAIYTYAAPSISNTTFSANSAMAGGAIFDVSLGSSGPLPGTIAASVFSGNSATAIGGAVWTQSPLTITGSSLTGNSSSGDGGAIFAVSSLLSLSYDTLSNNAASGNGGAIASMGLNTTISTSTISGNTAQRNGGGIENSGPLVVGNSTISGNTSQSWGGGLFNSGNATLSNDTVAGNSAAQGGGIYSEQQLQLSFITFSGNSATSGATGGGALNSNDNLLGLRNTIFANSAAGQNCQIQFVPAVQDQGYSLSDDSSCAAVLSATTDSNNVPAGLSSAGLANNGGPTQTIALLSTSPAVGAIPLASCVDAEQMVVATDQRGMSRINLQQKCDIGAYQIAQSSGHGHGHGHGDGDGDGDGNER